MKPPIIKNLDSYKGNKVPNQFHITTPDGAEYFQSYKSLIVKEHKGKTFLDVNKWNCSDTTSKYRSIFLGETTAETKKKINDGTYKLTDLNPEKK